MSETNVFSINEVPSPAAPSAMILDPRNGILKSANAIFVTDAVVGNRQIELEIFDGATVIARSVAGAVQTASLTALYHFGGWLDDTAFVAGAIRIAMGEMPMLPGWGVRIVDTAAISAGDSARFVAAFQD